MTWLTSFIFILKYHIFTMFSTVFWWLLVSHDNAAWPVCTALLAHQSRARHICCMWYVVSCHWQVAEKGLPLTKFVLHRHTDRSVQCLTADHWIATLWLIYSIYHHYGYLVSSACPLVRSVRRSVSHNSAVKNAEGSQGTTSTFWRIRTFYGTKVTAEVSCNIAVTCSPRRVKYDSFNINYLLTSKCSAIL